LSSPCEIDHKKSQGGRDLSSSALCYFWQKAEEEMSIVSNQCSPTNINHIAELHERIASKIWHYFTRTRILNSTFQTIIDKYNRKHQEECFSLIL